MDTKTPQFLSTAAAANMLGLSTTLIQSLVDKNELLGWKTRGGHRRISLQSIHEYQTQALGDKVIPSRLRAQPRVLVAIESPDSLAQLRQSSAAWQFGVDLQFVDSITEALLCLGSDQPDLLVVELTMPKAQQEKTLQALENFNARSRPISMVLVTKENDLRTTTTDAPNAIQLAPGPLTDVWLHAYLTGVVASCRT